MTARSEKPKVSGGVMRARVYSLLSECVERGIDWGWKHAHKHADDPGEEAIKTAIANDVMCEICEVFTFPDDD